MIISFKPRNLDFLGGLGQFTFEDDVLVLVDDLTGEGGQDIYGEFCKGEVMYVRSIYIKGMNRLKITFQYSTRGGILEW